jgi:eukaryotic-like serine/threonine-protein kinase
VHHNTAVYYKRTGRAICNDVNSESLGVPARTAIKSGCLGAIPCSVFAVEILRTAAPYELGQSQPLPVGTMCPVYIRAQAYLQARQGREAAAEFQRIINHRGIVLNFPLGALARLGLARAYALDGDKAKPRAAYDDFLNLWKAADPNIPLLQQARAEYANVQ